MKKLKRRLLFVLSHTGDILLGKSDYVYFSLPELYWRMTPYAQSSVRAALGDLSQQKMVNRVDRDGRVYYRLTSVGREYLFDYCKVPTTTQKVWDKGWRMVVLDDGALKRSEVRWLRMQLFSLGFKALSRGVWVTPHDVSNLIKQMLVKTKIAGGVVVLVTRRFIVGDDKAFAERVWSLEELNHSYLEFVKQSESLLRTVRSLKSLDNQVKAQFLMVFDRWYELLPQEPRLPKALLPGEWNYSEAGKMFAKLSNSVLELERESGN